MNWLPAQKRFIPACAGTTTAHADASVQELRFIPACAGTTARRSNVSFPVPGSSPRARGQLELLRSRCGAETVHPRVRGDNVALWAIQHKVNRFIPACAGTTTILGAGV